MKFKVITKKNGIIDRFYIFYNYIKFIFDLDFFKYIYTKLKKQKFFYNNNKSYFESLACLELLSDFFGNSTA